MKILDVSKFQPNIDYVAVAKQVSGVILRCGFTGWGTENQCNADPYFEKHYNGFKAAGVPVGVYYYSAADTIAKAAEEAKFCINLLKGKSFELPIYIDIEEPRRMEAVSKEQLTLQVETWAGAMEAAGFFVGVYANTDYFSRKLNHPRLADKYTIWLADYRANYNRSLRRDLHQYTSTAQVLGISGGVDMSNLIRADLIDVVVDSGLNGTNGAVEADPAPDHNLYVVKFGPCTAGDRDAAVALGNGLQLQPASTPAGTADNGRELFVVEFIPMTGGDKANLEMLGVKLEVPVEVSDGTQKTYTVQSGDSWWRIAEKTMGTGEKMEELAAANGKTILGAIHPGDVLVIPC